MSRRRTTVLSDLTVNIKGQVTIVNFIVVGFKLFIEKKNYFTRDYFGFTSMLVTDVRDSLSWRQVQDVDDRFEMLVTDFFH